MCAVSLYPVIVVFWTDEQSHTPSLFYLLGVHLRIPQLIHLLPLTLLQCIYVLARCLSRHQFVSFLHYQDGTALVDETSKGFDHPILTSYNVSFGAAGPVSSARRPRTTVSSKLKTSTWPSVRSYQPCSSVYAGWNSNRATAPAPKSTRDVALLKHHTADSLFVRPQGQSQ